MRTFAVALAISLSGLSATAHAHFILMSPPQTDPGDASQGKGPPPCGPDTAMAATPTMAQGGHAILLKVDETVPHDGFYRVVLALKSRSEIPVDNVVYNKAGVVLPPGKDIGQTSDHADFEAPPVFPVLQDNLFPHVGTGAQTFQMMIPLPNVTCDRCVMQVIEFMHPHGYNTGGGYFYHHCAELKITADPALPPFEAGTDGGASDGPTTHDASSDSATGMAGSNGAAGSTGGAAGTNDQTGSAGSPAGGGSAGTGTSATGAAGTSESQGAAGGGVGSAGSAGSSAERGSSGGCSLSDARGSAFGAGLLAMGIMSIGVRLRRRR